MKKFIVNNYFKILVFIVYTIGLYFLYRLCKFGIRKDLYLGLVCFIIFIILSVLLVKKEHLKSLLCLLLPTIIFGSMIVYCAIPYNGALAWKIDEWKNKEEITLKHNMLYEDGLEGIFLDLDLVDDLYVSNKLIVEFNDDGKVLKIDGFLYGKNSLGNKKSYLISYDVDKSDKVVVYKNGYTNGNYEEDKLVKPMFDIYKKINFKSIPSKGRHRLVYQGKQRFYSSNNLKIINGKMSNCIEGYALSIDEMNYVIKPEKIDEYTLKKEQLDKSVLEAKKRDSWYLDKSDGTMYYFLDDKHGYSLEVTDAALGSRFYVFNSSNDGGITFNRVNDDPFLSDLGVAEGIVFVDEKLGFIGLTNGSMSSSSLFVTRDGGISFELIKLDLSNVILPKRSGNYSYSDYLYYNMVEVKDDCLSIRVSLDASDNLGIVYKSIDQGKTWQYDYVINE